MTKGEACDLLGVHIGASSDEIRRAWRLKSLESHPDTGGSNELMIQLNRALELALANSTDEVANLSSDSDQRVSTHVASRVRRDTSSFTVSVLPVECWHALEVVAAMCGPTIQDDPPYLLEFLLHDSSLPSSRNAWCRCECVPEAGATTVHLTVGSSSNSEIPNIDDVRDHLVDQLNQIDWPD
jgi:hypothetical protein